MRSSSSSKKRVAVASPPAVAAVTSSTAAAASSSSLAALADRLLAASTRLLECARADEHQPLRSGGGGGGGGDDAVVARATLAAARTVIGEQAALEGASAGQLLGRATRLTSDQPAAMVAAALLAECRRLSDAAYAAIARCSSADGQAHASASGRGAVAVSSATAADAGAAAGAAGDDDGREAAVNELIQAYGDELTQIDERAGSDGLSDADRRLLKDALEMCADAFPRVLQHLQPSAIAHIAANAVRLPGLVHAQRRALM